MDFPIPLATCQSYRYASGKTLYMNRKTISRGEELIKATCSIICVKRTI
jgi:hypothetical protein